MFGLFEKEKEQEEDGEVAVTPEGNRLLLRIDSMSWCARLNSPGMERIWESKADQQRLSLETSHEEHCSRVIKFALDAIEQNARENEDYLAPMVADEDGVYLVVEGESFAFSDSRHPMLAGGTPDQIKLYGRRVLQADRVSLGREQTSFTDTTCFAKTSELQSMLRQFETNAVKVKGVVPISSLLMHQATEKPYAHAALWMGGEQTQCVLSDPTKDTVVLRTIPIGYLHFVQAICDKMGLEPEQAIEILGSRDNIASLDFKMDEASRRPAEQAFVPLLERLLKEFQRTKNYFVSQRLGSEPIDWSLFGAFKDVKGLETWLGKTYPVRVVFADILDQLESILKEEKPVLNLLSESSDDLVTVGRVKYTFKEGKFLPSSQIKRQRLMSSMNQVHLLDRLRGKQQDEITKITKADFEDEYYDEDDQPQEEDERPFFAALVGVMLLALYWGYDQYSVKSDRYASYTGSYQRALNESTQVSQELSGLSSQGVRISSGADDSDKVYWVEKFLELGNQMDEHIWFTNVYLAEEQNEVGGAKVSTKKLVMEGAVLPSTDGHIKKIAQYVGRLESKRGTYGFMADFRRIRFVHAKLDEEGTEQIVRFTLEALYDKNKRIEVMSEVVPEEEANPVLQMQEANRARNDELDDFRP